ncbi:hypothetical protein VTN77DRAFT_7289 [Rasamsonia byssochlamydoides]|uniref:uncharacterized protein n=1 Tax=Rasamsonia byssochlamydoides TaxID=89139 RepID=UPI003743CE38
MSASLLAALEGWPEPNYVDPVTRGNGIIVTNIVFGVLGTLAVLLRVYTRVWITSTFGADDVLIALAAGFSLAMMITMSIASNKYGWDRHIWDIPPSKLSDSNKFNLIFQVTFSLASSLTKLSLLWFCRRLIGNGGKVTVNYHGLALFGTIIFVSVCLVVFVLIMLLQCRPMKAYWDLMPTYPYHCINGEAFILSASIMNTITDLLTTLIPISLVWRVKLPKRQRIAVISIFGLGILVNVAGAFRTFYVHRTMVAKDHDSTWVGWPTCITASVEIGLGLIVASVPALRPLINHYLPHLLESTRKANDRAEDMHRNPRNKPIVLGSLSQSDHQPSFAASKKFFWRSDDVTELPANAQTYSSSRPLNEIEVTQTVELETYRRESDGSSSVIEQYELPKGLTTRLYP